MELLGLTSQKMGILWHCRQNMSLACASVKKANFVTNKAASKSRSRHRHMCLFQHQLSFIISPVFPHYFTPYLSIFIYFCGIHNLFTCLSIPTHAQLQHHRLKFIKNHLKNSYMFRPTAVFRELQCPR